MQVTLKFITPDAEAYIGEAAAECYDSSTEREACLRRAEHCMSVSHLATLRFAVADFHISGISRVASHQLVRVAHAGILQRSQRYTMSVAGAKEPLEFVPQDGEKHDPRARFTKLEEIWAAEQYQSGYAMSDIATAMGSNTGSVCRMLRRAGVDARKDEANSRGANSDFFDDLSDPIVAQILGFIAADGSISGNQITIEQAEENHAYLSTMLSMLRPGAKVLACKKSELDDVQNTYRIYITSKKIADQLKSLGISERKGLSFDPARLLERLPSSLHKWFWRGMIDGDGCISAPDLASNPRVTMSGTEQTCKAFVLFARSAGVMTNASVTKNTVGKKSFFVTIGGRKQVTTLLNVLFGDATPLVFPKKAYRAAAIVPELTAQYIGSLNLCAYLHDFVLPPAFSNNPTLAANALRLSSDANSAYRSAISAGMKKEDARYILPQGCTTSLRICGNFQMWHDLLTNRTAKKAQWEVREVALEILRQLNQHAPRVFKLPAD